MSLSCRGEERRRIDTPKVKVDEEDTPLVQVEMFINMLVKKQMAAEKEAVRRVQEATKVE